MDALKDHTIHFAGLKDGSHEFDFVLDDAFFKATGVEEYEGGHVKVKVNMDKSEHMLVCNIHVDGFLTLPCDHCNALMEQPVKGDQRQIFKLTHETGVEDEELVELGEHASDVNLTHYFFECISLHLPIRHVHPEGQCDPEVDQALSRIQVDHEPMPDPRWKALEALKNKK